MPAPDIGEILRQRDSRGLHEVDRDAGCDIGDAQLLTADEAVAGELQVGYRDGDVDDLQPARDGGVDITPPGAAPLVNGPDGDLSITQRLQSMSLEQRMATLGVDETRRLNDLTATRRMHALTPEERLKEMLKTNRMKTLGPDDAPADPEPPTKP